MSGVGGDQNGSKKRVTNEIAFVWQPGTLLQMNANVDPLLLDL